MVQFVNNDLLITVENIDEVDFVRMFRTLIWVIGRLQEEQEIFTDLHSLSWLAEAMVPSDEQIKKGCRKKS